jgi:hypothetical protein
LINIGVFVGDAKISLVVIKVVTSTQITDEYRGRSKFYDFVKQS